MVVVFFSCHDRLNHPYQSLTLHDYSDMRVPEYEQNSIEIQEEISRQIHSDKENLAVDSKSRAYYLSKRPWLWISRVGVDKKADTLISFLEGVEEMGFAT